MVDDENEEALDKKDIIDIIKWGKGKKLNVDYLQLPEIENYFNALKYLFVDFNSELETLKGNYSSYTNFDLIDSSWLSPTENNNSIVQIDCFRLLPILYYCKERLANKETINSVKLFRIIRYFYNLRKDTTVFKTASMQCVNGLKLIGKLDSNSDITDILSIKGISSSLINTEEKLKLNILKTATNRFKNENLFWRAEDINQNKGEISHLVNLTNSMNSENQLEFNLVVFEDMKAISIKGAKNWNKNFSPLQSGKSWFYNKVEENYRLYLYQGFETYAFRNNLGLFKGKDKMKIAFESHCVDSWILANQVVGGHTQPENKKLS